MRHILYRTTCLVTGKFYIGMHTELEPNDGYLGSGKLLKRSVKAHGAENHLREELGVFSSRDELANAELVTIATHRDDPLCMNLCDGGIGGNKVDWTPDRRAIASAHFKTIPRSREHYSKVALALSGHPLSEERRARISASLVGKEPSQAVLDGRAKAAKDRTGKSKFIWVLRKPDGELLEVESLADWCQQNQFNYMTMYGSQASPIIRGKAKGWQLVSKIPL